MTGWSAPPPLCGMGGDMVPVSVFHHSAFWFCRPVSRVHGALDLFYRVSNGLIDGKWLSIFSALMNEKRLLAPISQNRDASRKVSGTKEDQVGNDGMCFRDRTPSPFRAWLGDGRTRHHVYHPPGAWPMGVHSRRPHHYQSLPTPSPYRIHAHYSVTYVKQRGIHLHPKPRRTTTSHMDKHHVVVRSLCPLRR